MGLPSLGKEDTQMDIAEKNQDNTACQQTRDEDSQWSV